MRKEIWQHQETGILVVVILADSRVIAAIGPVHSARMQEIDIAMILANNDLDLVDAITTERGQYHVVDTQHMRAVGDHDPAEGDTSP